MKACGNCQFSYYTEGQKGHVAANSKTITLDSFCNIYCTNRHEYVLKNDCCELHQQRLPPAPKVEIKKRELGDLGLAALKPGETLV